MTEEDVKARVDAMIDRIRVVWGVAAIASLAYFFMSDLQWWALPLFAIGLMVGYNLHVVVGGARLVHEVLHNGGMVERKAEEVEILDTCTEYVGRYYDFDVPEWIDVKIGEMVKRYVFKDFAPKIGDGFGLPASGDHVLYKAGIFQPAQSE